MNKCPICLSDKHKRTFIYLNWQFSYLKGEDNIFKDLQVYVCQECGFGWSYPCIEPSAISEFYSRIYRDKSSPYAVSPKPVDKYNNYSINVRAISQILLAKTFRDFKPGDSFLDIGCGRGVSLWTAKKLIPGIKLYAVEPDKYSHPTLKAIGADIYPLPFDRGLVEFMGPKKVDFIMMSVVLEHFSGNKIIPALENIRGLLSDDGVFLCEVPDADLCHHQLMRNGDAPHFSFFTSNSLETALKRAGLDIKFSGKCNQDYATWWQENVSNPELRKSRSNKQRLDEKLSNILSHLPDTRIKQGLTNLYCKLTYPNIFDYLASEPFSYGQGRACLRIIATKGGGD